MSNGLVGKRALIVGAYGGMATPVVLALVGEGVHCALVGRDEQRLSSLSGVCAEAGRPAVPIVCDIAEIESIEGAVSQGDDLNPERGPGGLAPVFTLKQKVRILRRGFFGVQPGFVLIGFVKKDCSSNVYRGFCSLKILYHCLKC